MSRIYSALVKAKAEKADPRITFSREKPSTISLRTLGWQHFNLEWKVTGIIVTTLFVVGLLFVTIANQLMGRALQAQIDHRALVMATNLSDAAAAYVLAGNTREVHVLVTKYARLSGAAYAVIEDGKGQIVAHSLGAFPPELRETLTRYERGQVSRRVVTLAGDQGKTVYETRAPILEGQLGTARVGLWEETVAAEIYSALRPMVGLIAILLVAGVILFLFLVRGIVRPIRGLSDIASKMSTGDLETPLEVDSQDEIGELACSLERMRVSLKAAIARGLTDNLRKSET
jgi:sensor histidine kinase regulating citrate/malate metabolism